MAVSRTRKTKPKTKKKGSRRSPRSSSRIAIGGEIWPLERDVLYRPDRLKYVRKLIKEEGCVFCRASREKVSFDTLCVHQTPEAMVVLNKFPYNSGHLLVLPRRHCGDLLGLTPEEWQGVSRLLRRTVKVVGEVYGPAGFNVGLNHGAVAGAGIPEHLHFHVVPRWSGDLNFFPLIAETKVVVETLETSYARITEGFQQIRGPE